MKETQKRRIKVSQEFEPGNANASCSMGCAVGIAGIKPGTLISRTAVKARAGDVTSTFTHAPFDGLYTGADTEGLLGKGSNAPMSKGAVVRVLCYKYCLFIQYFAMSNDYNPRKLITDREGIIGIIEQGRQDTVIITASLSATGYSALQKFLTFYIKEQYGTIAKMQEWAGKAEVLMRRISSLRQDPVLTAEAHQTLSSLPGSIYIRWKYFYWYVEPKEGVQVHPFDKQVSQRIIKADAEEHARTFVPPQMSGRSD